jgi:inorganic pyrophosphatase
MNLNGQKPDMSSLWDMLGLRYKSHPWHGLDIGNNSPSVVNSFIEVVPTDTVKYEIDKLSGHLKVDRPQKFSNIVPALYGFIPKTYCAEQIANLCMNKSGKKGVKGDHDPLDILVLTERTIGHGGIIVPAIPIGGFRMIDGDEADDKIIAVMKGDVVYENWQDIGDCPNSIVERLRHYFLTYKKMPGDIDHPIGKNVEITHTYGREEAHEVIRLSQMDYEEHYGNINLALSKSTLEAIAKKLLS